MDRETEKRRSRHGLKPDKQDETFTRMLAKDGAVWPRFDTGYRHFDVARYVEDRMRLAAALLGVTV